MPAGKILGVRPPPPGKWAKPPSTGAPRKLPQHAGADRLRAAMSGTSGPGLTGHRGRGRPAPIARRGGDPARQPVRGRSSFPSMSKDSQLNCPKGSLRVWFRRANGPKPYERRRHRVPEVPRAEVRDPYRGWLSCSTRLLPSIHSVHPKTQETCARRTCAFNCFPGLHCHPTMLPRAAACIAKESGCKPSLAALRPCR